MEGFHHVVFRASSSRPRTRSSGVPKAVRNTIAVEECFFLADQGATSNPEPSGNPDI